MRRARLRRARLRQTPPRWTPPLQTPPPRSPPPPYPPAPARPPSPPNCATIRRAGTRHPVARSTPRRCGRSSAPSSGAWTAAAKACRRPRT
ncbi:hypothetical protein [Streptomyces sp. Ag109_G2-15]|uniref:hypothetical protein n=1 Tax=Streptomyces sp. Ag109_G2-15 TaxID=1938850 RepID=UPI00359C7FC5